MGFRSEVRDGFLISLTAFQAANPTLVDGVYKARPPSIAERSSVFVGGISESYVHLAGVRQRTAEVEIVYTRHLGDNEETSDVLEDGADALLDWLTLNYHLTGAGTVQEPQRSTPIELNEGGVIVPAIAITTRATKQEPRF
jgi:hypothetical protein